MLHRSDGPAQSWRENLDTYRDIRLLYIFLLGCSSGFPFVLIGSNLSGWLTDAGLTRASIAGMGAVFGVYALCFLWAPLVDRIKLPWLHDWLGHRRSWIFTLQGLILIAVVAMAFTNPAAHLGWTAVLALMVATCGATKDIAIDAFRIETIGKDAHRVPAASAMAIIGWWTGFSLPGYLAFANAEAIGWAGVYLWMAGIVGMLMVFTLLVREPVSDREALQKETEARYASALHIGSTQWERLLVWLTVTVVEPFADFFRRNGWQLAVTILLFVFLFKIGEAFLGRMSIVFYREIGFSNDQIAHYSKLVGFGLTVLFTLIGSRINIRYGIVRGLFIGGVAMAASNLMFSWIALVGPSEKLFLAAILVDNFCAAFSSVAFVSFLTWLTGKTFTGTQYALLAAVGTLGRTFLASSSGVMVDFLDGNWALFFLITALMVIPGLLLLLLIERLLRERLKDPAP